MSVGARVPAVPSRLLLRPGAPLDEGWTVGTTAAEAGWRYVGFSAHRLAGGETLHRTADDEERALVLLAGQAEVRVDGRRLGTAGTVESRSSIFDGTPPATVLVAPGSALQVTARGALHVALASAPGGESKVTRLVEPKDVRVEDRGRGNTYRRVHHLVPPGSEAGRLIVVEVFTPGGNWSSYPPHKHDTEDPPRESYLEEIYYYAFERPQGHAFQRVYTNDAGLDELVVARDGDLVLVPRGFHTVGVPAGYDCYYLNLLAGPGRLWRFTVDPEHGWLMDWSAQGGSSGRG